MTLSSGAFRRDEDGLLWLRTSTDSQPQPYYLTLNIGEKPREPNPTKLSQILEENADPKYRLSSRACQGILNRAERRGKELPKELKEALLEQSQYKETPLTETQGRTGGVSPLTSPTHSIQPTDTQSVSKNEPENLGGARESCSKVSEQEPCQRSTTSPSAKSVDCRNATEIEEVNITLQAKPNGGFSANYGGVVRVQGCDVYNGNITGDVAATLNASSDAPNHSGTRILMEKPRKDE